MKEQITVEQIKKLCDDYLIPAVKATANQFIIDHIKQYHQEGPGVNLSIGGVDFNIKVKK